MNNLYHISSNEIPSVARTNKCIVLDLDQTLIATQDGIPLLKRLGIFSDPKLIDLRNRIYVQEIDDIDKPGSGVEFSYWGVTRPYIQDFLLFCFSYFKVVAVWSAGQRKYVESIVDHLFRDLPKPHIVFTYDDIIFNQKGEVVKPLNKIFNAMNQHETLMTYQNTLALDDNPSTYSNNIGNGVLIPPYEPGPSIIAMSAQDISLLQFMFWLQQPEIETAEDVRMLDKSNIFTTSIEQYKNNLALYE